MNPRDYDALANLYRAFGMNGDQKEAAATLQTIQTLYPGKQSAKPGSSAPGRQRKSISRAAR